MEEWVFVELALNMQCHIVKNTLLHSEIFSNFTGWDSASSLVYQLLYLKTWKIEFSLGLVFVLKVFYIFGWISV